MTETYDGWEQVPAHLMTKTALGRLEFPRTCEGRKPDAYVTTTDWNDSKRTFRLFDARECAPTTASARQLEAAQRRSETSRTCQDCGARCQAPLPPPGELPLPGGLCAACRHIALLRHDQAQHRRYRDRLAADVAALLSGPPAVVLQVDLHRPPRTAGGHSRRATAARLQVAELDGTRLLDINMRLVGPRAQWVPDGAIDKADGLAQLREVTSAKRLVVWSVDELHALRTKIDPDGDHPSYNDVEAWVKLDTEGRDSDRLSATRANAPGAAIETVATQWRGEIDPQTGRLVPSFAPGTPDRLALLLRRIADDAPAEPPRDAAG